MAIDLREEKFDIIIEAGQAVNICTGEKFFMFENILDDRILELNKDYTVSMACTKYPEKVDDGLGKTLPSGAKGDYALAFAKEYVKKGYLVDGRRLMIIRASEELSGFFDGKWSPDGAAFNKMKDLIISSLSLNPENRVVSCLWLQGETDAKIGVSYPVYEAAFNEFYTNVQQIVDFDKIPFIVSSMVFQREGFFTDLRYNPTVKVLQNFCLSKVNCQYVPADEFMFKNFDTNDLDSYFSVQVMHDFGLKYFEAYEDTLQKMYSQSHQDVDPFMRKNFMKQLFCESDVFLNILSQDYEENGLRFETEYGENINANQDDIFKIIGEDKSGRFELAVMVINHREQRFDLNKIFLPYHLRFNKMGYIFILMLYMYLKQIGYKLDIVDFANRKFYKKLIKLGAEPKLGYDDVLHMNDEFEFNLKRELSNQ